MAKIRLTDRFIASPKRVPPKGKRGKVADSHTPGMYLVVTDTGHRSFAVIARYPLNPKHPVPRTLGEWRDSRVPGAKGESGRTITLEAARAKASEWLALIERGIDPKIEEDRQRAATLRKQANNFGAVAAEFIDRHVKGPALVELERLAAEKRKEQPDLSASDALAQVRGDAKNRALVQQSAAQGLAKKADAEHTIKTEFVQRWGIRPITEIYPEECSAAIRAIVKRGSPYQAHNAFGYLRQFFNWAIGTGEFGLDASPMRNLSPVKLIGDRVAREHTLNDADLRAVWRAAGGLMDAGAVADRRRRDRPKGDGDGEPIGYPYGPLFRMLMLTGQREREVADMVWSEVDFDQAIWTIPSARMKGGATHVVPLAPDALALLRSLPRFTAGDHVFTTTDGEKPVNGFSKAKVRIDKVSGVTGWKIHDLRRTVRTHFSALPIQDVVREAVIAHAQKALHKVYDRHTYLAEKRECLTLWEVRLRGIVKPAPDNVVPLHAARETTMAEAV
jgi:integrase